MSVKMYNRDQDIFFKAKGSIVGSLVGNERRMSSARIVSFLVVGMLLVPAYAIDARAEEDRAKRAMEKNDRNGDGKVSRKEWRKSKDIFDAIDSDDDGFLTVTEFRARFGSRKTKTTKARSQSKVPPKSAIAPAGKAQGNMYFIDAHSQWDHRVDEERVLSLMNHGGVYRTLLSVHLKRPWVEVVAFGKAAPERIIPTVQIKGRGYHKGPRGKFFDRLNDQMGNDAFGAMAEVHVWHDSDGGKYQEIRIDFDDGLFLAAFNEAKRKGWPLIVHIEFASLSYEGKRGYMEKLEEFIRTNRNHPIVMIHMAQLEEPNVRRLLASHPNLHFMTSHASPFYQFGGKPFINLIDDDKFKPQWKKLILDYPDRFVFALDNVFSKFWMPDLYLDKMKMWWKVAADLPNDIAQAFAHGNAERLWKLTPRLGGGMMTPDEAMKALGPVTGYSANAAHR